MNSLLNMCVFVLTWTPVIMTRGVDWDDVILAESNSSVTLPCNYGPFGGKHAVHWSVTPLGGAETALLSANQNTEFQHISRVGLGLANQNYRRTGDLSLRLVATEADVGLYRCLIEEGSKQLKMAVVLLALVNISVVPMNPVPEYSTVRLSSRVTPAYVISMATWHSPAGVVLRSERVEAQGYDVTKLARFRQSHQGRYTYTARPHGNNRRTSFQFTITVTAAMSKVAVFPDPIYGPVQSLACRSRATVVLPCPPVLGDYLLLYWKQADSPSMQLAYEHDRWRQISTNHTRLRLRLQGPTPSFSFLLIPEQRDGGEFRCEVFLNDQPHAQSTQLSVVHELSQVQGAVWSHQNRSGTLPKMDSSLPGRIGTAITLPVTTETAGNYTCTIQLHSGVKAKAVYLVTLPPRESSSGSVHSLLPSLSALLLLVPVTTVVAGVFLWRRTRSITRRGVEHSSHCGEVENIYENPEDVRQVPQRGVYMALKPIENESVYKELDRYDQCK